MGDILHVSLTFFSALKFRSIILQLRHINLIAREPFQIDTSPARIIASGHVTAVEHSLNTFALTIWQIVVRGSTLAHLSLHAVMGLNPEWRQPNHQIPSSSRVVMLTGDIVTVENGVVVAAVDDVAFLP